MSSKGLDLIAKKARKYIEKDFIDIMRENLLLKERIKNIKLKERLKELECEKE